METWCKTSNSKILTHNEFKQIKIFPWIFSFGTQLPTISSKIQIELLARRLFTVPWAALSDNALCILFMCMKFSFETHNWANASRIFNWEQCWIHLSDVLMLPLKSSSVYYEIRYTELNRYVGGMNEWTEFCVFNGKVRLCK